MRWVKLTLPPRPRARWLLMTMRLSASSFAGTARTLVAVGTWSEVSMFWAMRAAAPRSGTRSTSASDSLAAAGLTGAGLAGGVALAGCALASALGWAVVSALGSRSAVGLLGALCGAALPSPVAVLVSAFAAAASVPAASLALLAATSLALAAAGGSSVG